MTKGGTIFTLTNQWFNWSYAAANCHFSNSINDWGHFNFMSLDELNTLAKGFLVNNTLVVEAQIHVLTVVKELSGSCAFMHSKT